MNDNLYEVLGVDKLATASEIKKSYRKLVKEHHPDKGGDEDAFKKVSYAYEILSNKDKKSIYDSRGHDGLNHQGQNHGFRDMFQEFARQQQQQQEINRSSVKVKLVITLEDVFYGKDVKFKYDRIVECDTCSGKGGSEPEVCQLCNGQGKIIKTFQTGHGHMQHVTDCHECGGNGTTFKDICKICHGNGVHYIKESMDVKIPHGYLTGQTIIEEGKGNIMSNGQYGPLIMIIEVKPHDKFEIVHDYRGLSTYDLESILKIPYETFVLGGKVEFTTINGKKVKLSVPKLSKVGNRLKLSKMGLKSKELDVRGDQHLILDIILPTSINDEEKELLEKLKKLKE